MRTDHRGPYFVCSAQKCTVWNADANSSAEISTTVINDVWATHQVLNRGCCWVLGRSAKRAFLLRGLTNAGATYTKKKRVQTWSETGHTQMLPCFCKSLDVITVSKKEKKAGRWDVSRSRNSNCQISHRLIRLILLKLNWQIVLLQCVCVFDMFFWVFFFFYNCTDIERSGLNGIDRSKASCFLSFSLRTIPAACYYLHTEQCSSDFDSEGTSIVRAGSVQVNKQETTVTPRRRRSVAEAIDIFLKTFPKFGASINTQSQFAISSKSQQE